MQNKFISSQVQQENIQYTYVYTVYTVYFKKKLIMHKYEYFNRAVYISIYIIHIIYYVHAL